MGSTAIDLVVIDPSGTLVHDDEIVGTALLEALDAVDADAATCLEHGRAQYVANTRGISILAVLRSLLGDEGRARYALRAFELAYPSVLAQGGVAVVPPAPDVLTALRQAGRRVCLLSRLPQSCMETTVDALRWGECVDLVVPPEPGSRTPPHPDLVLSAIMRLRVMGVREVAVVANSVNPLVAGTRAGATAIIGVIDGLQSRVDLERVPHTHVVHSVADVPALLDVVSARVHAA